MTSNPYDQQNIRASESLTQHYTKIRDYLHQFDTPSWTIDDLCQETYFRAHRAIMARGPPNKPLSWLIAIAKNVAMDTYRKNNRVQRTYDIIAATVREPEPGAPENDTIVNEARSLLQDSVEDLSDLDQRLINGFYRERKACYDLAEETGLSVANVKVRLFRVRGRLRHELLARGGGLP